LLSIAGMAVLFATWQSTTFPVTTHLSTSLRAHEDYSSIRYLSVRDYEIRISVPPNFEGELLIYDYEGMKRLLVQEVDEPKMNIVVNGPSIVDFRPVRRGYYLLLLRNLMNDSVDLGISFVGKPGIEPDTLQDAVLTASLGLVLSIVFAISDRWCGKRP